MIMLKIMTKKSLDKIVLSLIEESKKRGKLYSKEELKERFSKEYSKNQTERIFHRYFFLENL